MEYSDVKSILYQSEEIQVIPDKWEESIPVRCMVDGDEYEAFLYWNYSNSKVELKRMIGINRESGCIIVLNASDMIEKFKLQRIVFQPPVIDDYDRYFEDKKRYEILYAKLCSSENAFKIVGKEELFLLSKLVGEDLLSNLFSIIAGDYLDKLQIGD